MLNHQNAMHQSLLLGNNNLNSASNSDPAAAAAAAKHFLSFYGALASLAPPQLM